MPGVAVDPIELGGLRLKGAIFIIACTIVAVCYALSQPHVGVIAYFGYAVLCPTWNWRWALPAQGQYQMFLALASLFGLVSTGFQGNRLLGVPRFACLSLTIYAVLAAVSSLTSIMPPQSWWYMDYFSKIWLMAMVGIFCINTPRKLYALMWVVVLAQGVNAYNVNELYFKYGYSIVAQLGWNYLDNNTYALSTLPMFGFSFALACYAPKWWQKTFCAAIVLLQTHQIMLTDSRGGMLGGLLVVVLAALHMPKNLLTIGGALATLVVGASLAGPSVHSRFNTAFRDRDELDASAESRYELWQAGYRIMVDYPILGVGAWAGEFMVPAYTRYGASTRQKALHNLFFEVGTGSGVAALLAYCLFFLSVYLGLIRIRWTYGRDLPNWAKAASMGVLCGLPGFWLSSMFSSGALIESSYVATIIGAATLAILRRQQEHADDMHAAQRQAMPVPLWGVSAQRLP